MKSRAREQASSSIPLRGRHERGAEKNGKQMRSQVASRSENHDGKQQDMTTHEQNAKSDRQTRPEPAHNSHKSKTNDTPRPPRVRPRGQERERKKWSIWYYVVQFSSDKTPPRSPVKHTRSNKWVMTTQLACLLPVAHFGLLFQVFEMFVVFASHNITARCSSSQPHRLQEKTAALREPRRKNRGIAHQPMTADR